MGTPAGYRAFCAERGLDPHHPEDWSAAGHAEYRAWKLRTVQAGWRQTYDVLGMRAIYHQTAEGRRALIRRVREDVQRALEPLCRSPWARCPCHPIIHPPAYDELGYPVWFKAPLGEPETQVTDDELDAWIAEDPLARAFVAPRVAKALTFIERFNPAKRGTAFGHYATKEVRA